MVIWVILDFFVIILRLVLGKFDKSYLCLIESFYMFEIVFYIKELDVMFDGD